MNLRTALDAAGFTRTRIVAADEAPQMAERPGTGRAGKPRLYATRYPGFTVRPQ
jgi:hypothetical protein